MAKMIELVCAYCHKDPGPKKTNPNLWNGFLDKETNQHICWNCQREHYRIKSKNGTQDFNMVEFPVQLHRAEDEFPPQETGTEIILGDPTEDYRH